MERLIYLDTHTVIWLSMGDLDRFPVHLQQEISELPVLISPIVLLELQYLFEIKRSKESPDKTFKCLEKDIGLKICSKDFTTVVKESIKQTWTRDPFDRIIVAQALISHAVLITRDETIQKHYPKARWS